MGLFSFRTMTYAAIFAPFVFCIMWTLSAVTDSQWVFGELTLSTLGVSENALSAFLFNAACIVSGILGLLFGIARYRNEEGINRIGSILISVGMVFLALVGVFTKAPETLYIHVFVAGAYGVLQCIAIIMSIIGDKRYVWVSVTSLILIIFVIVMIFTQTKAMAEALIVIAGMVWFFVQGLKYRLYGKDFPTYEE